MSKALRALSDAHQKSLLGTFYYTSCASGNRFSSHSCAILSSHFEGSTPLEHPHGSHHPSRFFLGQFLCMDRTELHWSTGILIHAFFAPTNSGNSSRCQHCRKFSFDLMPKHLAQHCVLLMLCTQEYFHSVSQLHSPRGLKPHH